MEMDVAPVICHVRYEDSPALMGLRLAAKSLITGGEPAVVVTVTVSDAVTDP